MSHRAFIPANSTQRFLVPVYLNGLFCSYFCFLSWSCILWPVIFACISTKLIALGKKKNLNTKARQADKAQNNSRAGSCWSLHICSSKVVWGQAGRRAGCLHTGTAQLLLLQPGCADPRRAASTSTALTRLSRVNYPQKACPACL